MKKTYIQPETMVVRLQTEGMIAVSLKIDGKNTVDTSNGGQLSNGLTSPWSSSNWENN